MKTPPPGYIECIERMYKAAREWLAAHPCAQLTFIDIEAEFARRAGLPAGTKVAVGCDLQTAIPLWACSDDARAFLQAMEDASNHEATVLQAQVIVAQLRPPDANHFEAGEHHCPWCDSKADHATSYDGIDQMPDGPMLVLCIECTKPYWHERGAVARRVEQAEEDTFPEETRKMIGIMRDGLEKAKAEMGAQS
jgi:hypothetical protein